MNPMLQKLKTALLGALLTLCLCACGAVSPAESSAPAEEQAELVFPLLISGEAPENLERVEAALNDYVSEKIGADIRLVPAEVSTLESYYLLQNSAEQQADFVCLQPAETELFSMADAGVLLPLDELLEEYGGGILDAAGEVLAVGQLNGVQYLIPQVKETYTMGASLEFNAALVKKYNLDITEVETITDVEPMLEIIAENEPEVVPFVASTSEIGYTQFLSGYDNLIDTLGVLNLQADDSLTVVDWYETEEFLGKP